MLLGACSSQPNSPLPSGAETFTRHCASCHGARADGTGPVAAAMRDDVPDLTLLARRNGGEFPADRAASYIDGRSLPPAHGSRTMPIWGPAFDPMARRVVDAETAGPRVAELVEYLRALQR
jgi:mono/diheme cytochrome c family protein